MSEATFEFTDRYQALGIAYPDVETMCGGQCDGVGCYPLVVGDRGGISSDYIHSAEEVRRWNELHATGHSYRFFLKQLFKHREWWYWKTIVRDFLNGDLLKCDGFHFITCPDCEGTGKRPTK